MKKLLIVVHVLMFTAAAAAFAAPADDADVALVETDATPLSADPITENKWDRRFGSYELESFGCCGL